MSPTKTEAERKHILRLYKDAMNKGISIRSFCRKHRVHTTSLSRWWDMYPEVTASPAPVALDSNDTHSYTRHMHYLLLLVFLLAACGKAPEPLVPAKPPIVDGPYAVLTDVQTTKIFQYGEVCECYIARLTRFDAPKKNTSILVSIPVDHHQNPNVCRPICERFVKTM